MGEARYLYCIGHGRQKEIFGKIGIEGNEVYTLNYRDLYAVVHNCPPEPYKSEDEEKVKSWIIAHEKVVETAWARFGTVLPLSFDTIINDNQQRDAENNIKEWLKEEYAILKQKLEKLRDKAEFGVQIYWDLKVIGRKLAETSEEIRSLNEDIKSKSKGVAYMYRQKLEELTRKKLESKAEIYFKDFYEQINRCVDEIKVEKTKKSEDDRQMLMNISCLLPREKSKVLGGELEKINKREEFFVRFTGPWPPYSFVQ
jgi:hypothetical protein